MVRSRLLAQASHRDGRAVFVLSVVGYGLFSLLDLITTTAALQSGGGEGNSIAASLYAEHGAGGLLLFKAVVVMLIVGVLVWMPRRVMSLRVATWVATVFTIAVALAVIGNVQAIATLQHHPLLQR